MRVFVKSCCRAIGMTLALVWVPRISEAADHQVWLKLSIDVPIFAPWDDGRIVFDAEQEEKFGKRGFIDSETLAMIKLEACPYFAIRLGDRFVYERSRGRGDLVPEHRPTLDVVLTTPEFLTLKLDSRTRFEYRMIDGKDDHMRYRERLRLKTEWSVTRWKISPFVSEELFFSDRQGGSAANAFVRNRAQIGFCSSLFRRFQRWFAIRITWSSTTGPNPAGSRSMSMDLNVPTSSEALIFAVQ